MKDIKCFKHKKPLNNEHILHAFMKQIRKLLKTIGTKIYYVPLTILRTGLGAS
jgi:hypothetical protein